MHCHICNNSDTVTRIPFEGPWVSSDCKPWSGEATFLECQNCGGLTKEATSAWHTQVDKIYRDYDVYHQAGGEEQKIHDADGALVSRSSGLVNHMLSAVTLPNVGRILDIGSGNGAFLKAFHKHRSSWHLVGNDLTDTFADEINSISRDTKFVKGDLSAIEGQFDVITMVHCLEHIVDPTSFLASVRPMLRPGGLLFVQVPNVTANAFDLTIYDHVTHFTANVLERVVNEAGFSLKVEIADWVQKEHSLLASPGSPARKVERLPDPQFAKSKLNWLTDMAEFLRDAAAEHDQIGIFGSSIAGTWAASMLGTHVSFFVDEDEDRIGRKLMGKPIISPSSAPAGSAIALPFNPPIAAAIAQRHGDRLTLLSPPPA